MPKWEVIFARTLTPAEHGVRRSAGQGGPGPKKAPKPGLSSTGSSKTVLVFARGFHSIGRSQAGVLTRTGQGPGRDEHGLFLSDCTGFNVRVGRVGAHYRPEVLPPVWGIRPFVCTELTRSPY
jgi:hypothetical protein